MIYSAAVGEVHTDSAESKGHPKHVMPLVSVSHKLERIQKTNPPYHVYTGYFDRKISPVKKEKLWGKKRLKG